MPAPTLTTPIDIVDEQDQPVGLMERGQVLAAGANFRVAHIFVFDDAGRLLLQQLGQVRTRNPLRWGSSVAAYLHAGETYDEAAQRRLREELGLDVPVSFVDKVRMRDHNSTKFIGLYRAHAHRARNAEPEHLERLEYRDLAWVADALEREPELFTETFALLFPHYTKVMGGGSDQSSGGRGADPG